MEGHEIRPVLVSWPVEAGGELEQEEAQEEEQEEQEEQQQEQEEAEQEQEEEQEEEQQEPAAARGDRLAQLLEFLGLQAGATPTEIRAAISANGRSSRAASHAKGEGEEERAEGEEGKEEGGEKEEDGENSGRRRDDSGWAARLAKLKKYKRRHGDCNVPHRWAAGPTLGNWVKDQRVRKEKLGRGEPSNGMTAVRAANLDTLGFAWELSTGSSTRVLGTGHLGTSAPGLQSDVASGVSVPAVRPVCLSHPHG